MFKEDMNFYQIAVFFPKSPTNTHKKQKKRICNYPYTGADALKCLHFGIVYRNVFLFLYIEKLAFEVNLRVFLTSETIHLDTFSFLIHFFFS